MHINTLLSRVRDSRTLADLDKVTAKIRAFGDEGFNAVLELTKDEKPLVRGNALLSLRGVSADLDRRLLYRMEDLLYSDPDENIRKICLPSVIQGAFVYGFKTSQESLDAYARLGAPQRDQIQEHIRLVQKQAPARRLKQSIIKLTDPT